MDRLGVAGLGGYALLSPIGDGGAYNPATDTWRPMSNDGAPSPRWGAAAAWTGTKLLIWGGVTSGSPRSRNRILGGGAQYDPATNTWTPISGMDAPSARMDASATWTGERFLVWGGSGYGADGGSCPKGVHIDLDEKLDGASSDPSTDTWTPIQGEPSLCGPETRVTGFFKPSAWTGDRWIVWGRGGATYDPMTDQWTSITADGAPARRRLHALVWTSSRVLVWGGLAEDSPVAIAPLADGGAYDPVADAWTAIVADGAPLARWSPAAVWTGSEMLIWGGGAAGSAGRSPLALNDGYIFTPPSEPAPATEIFRSTLRFQ